MSEIEKDREIAAKSGSGSWVVRDPIGVGEGRPIRYVNTENGPSVLTVLGPALADHIVRLHNRQPKYDALVDVMLRWRELDHPMPDVEALTIIADEMRVAIADLDRE